MFSKIIVAFVASLAVFVAAAPTPGNDINNSCNTGKMYCCNDSYEGQSEEAKTLATLLKISIPANTKVGATCSPITALTAVGGSNSCNQQPVCCTGNEYSGILVIGCSPVSVNL